MIVYDLKCAQGHRFEGWFSSADDYSSQRDRSILSCPACGVADVERVLSAPRLNMGAAEKPSMPAEFKDKDPLAIAQMLYSRMLDEMLSKSEDVGNRFPEEARKIYYEEAAARAIRGTATQAEHDELVDEGIPVARLPVPPAGKLN
ncbi:MAG: DUF1178 family protein [Betaproteobacteria bacterium]|nr:DUF1178 family protein [Betaproteobacteria bacterium]